METTGRVLRPVDGLKNVCRFGEVEKVVQRVIVGWQCLNVHHQSVGVIVLRADTAWKTKWLPARTEGVLDEVENAPEVVAVIVGTGEVVLGPGNNRDSRRFPWDRCDSGGAPKSQRHNYG
jgi:hypothetical protein